MNTKLSGTGRVELENGEIYDGIFRNGVFMKGVFYSSYNDAYLSGVFQNNLQLLERGQGYPYALILASKQCQYPVLRDYRTHCSVVFYLPTNEINMMKTFDPSQYRFSEEDNVIDSSRFVTTPGQKDSGELLHPLYPGQALTPQKPELFLLPQQITPIAKVSHSEHSYRDVQELITSGEGGGYQNARLFQSQQESVQYQDVSQRVNTTMSNLEKSHKPYPLFLNYQDSLDLRDSRPPPPQHLLEENSAERQQNDEEFEEQEARTQAELENVFAHQRPNNALED